MQRDTLSLQLYSEGAKRTNSSECKTKKNVPVWQSFLFIAVFAHIELTTGNHIGFSKRREKGKEAEEREEKKEKGKEENIRNGHWKLVNGMK